MSTVLNGASASGTDVSRGRGMPVAPPLRAPRARRRPALLALGVGLVAVGALVTVWLVSSTGQRTSVLVMAHDVAYGAPVTDSDLATAEASLDPLVSAFPASERARVVGMIAATTLTTGSLLSPSQLATTTPPAAGQVLVGVAVPATRMPASGLVAGDQILIVDTPAADADPPAGVPATITASVVRVGAADLNGVSVVDVTVAPGDGPALAARSATGRIAIVVQPRSG
jgi:hypothetical protein